MQRRAYVSLLGTALVAGCSENSADGGDDSGSEDETTETVTDSVATPRTTTDTASDTPADPDSPIRPATHEFSGSGDDSFENVELANHLTLLEASHTGTGNFVVAIEEDGQGAVLLSEEGNWSGTVAHSGGEGIYTVAVTGDGEWNLTIRQPRAESGDPVPASLSGAGKEVRGPFSFDRETFTVSGSYSGGEEMSIRVYDTSGQWETIFRLYGDGTVDESEYDATTDVGWVAVSAVGDWTLTFG